MSTKRLFSQFQLAYSPMSNFDFCYLRRDPLFQRAVEQSSLYVIAQRPVLSFENIHVVDEIKAIYFEIHQKNNSEKLQVTFPFFQEHIATNPQKEILLRVGSISQNKDYKKNPYSDIHGIKFFEEDKFLVWFSPEKFLQNYWSGHFSASITGDIRNFTNYQVHYVGKATGQGIWKRLTSHSTLQEILSIEYPFTFGDLPTHEIVLLLFKFQENLQMHAWDGSDSTLDDFIASLRGENMPTQDTIFLDAEKALIKAMQPKYNKEMYKKYPESKDGLYGHRYDGYSYSFVDPITLKYEKDEIRGKSSPIGGDRILIKNDKLIGLVKF